MKKTIIQTNQVSPAFEDNQLAYARQEGTQHGGQNQPVSQTMFTATIVNHVKTHIQSELDKAHADHGPLAQKVAANNFEREGRMKISELETGRNQLAHEKGQCALTMESCRIPNGQLWRRNLSRLILLGLSLTDGYMIYLALLGMAMPFIISLLSGVFISAGIYVATEMFARWISKGSTVKTKLIRGAIALATVFIFFLCIGFIRVDGMSVSNGLDAQINGNAEIPPQHSALMLALFSTFVFGAGLLVTLKYLLTDDDKILLQNYEKAKDDCKKKVEEIAKKNEAITKLQSEIATKNLEANQKLEDAANRERKLVSLADRVIQEYIDHNIRHRTDGIVPEFFINREPIQFNTFVNHLIQHKIQ